MLPFDVFGTFIETAAAITCADTVWPRRKVSERTTTRFAIVVVEVCLIPCEKAVVVVTRASRGVVSTAGASGALMGVVDDEGSMAGGASVGAIVGATVGAMVGAMVGGTVGAIVGATVVVGTTVNAPTVAAVSCGARDVSTPTWP